MVFIAVRQEVKRIDNLVVVHALELGIKAIYRAVYEVGNQYNVGSLLWSSSTNNPNLAALWHRCFSTIAVSSSLLYSYVFCNAKFLL